MRTLDTLAALAWSLAIAGPSAALAHGPAPAVLEVVAVTPGSQAEPRLVRNSVGLAENSGEVWRFLCPAAWGDVESPLAVSRPGLPAVWVFGEQEAVIFDPGGVPTTVDGSERLRSARVRDVSASEAGGFALVRTEAGQEVVALEEPPRTVAELTDRWDSLVVLGAAILLADLVDGDLALARLPVDAAGLTEALVPLDADGFTPDLRVVEERLFVVLDGPGSRRLIELDVEHLFDRSLDEGSGEVAPADPLPPILWLETDASVHGPAVVGDRLAVVSGGEFVFLTRTDGETSVAPVPDPRRFTCLSVLADAPWACAQDAIYPVGPEGPGTASVFAISDLAPPLVGSIDAESQARCEAQWLDYAGHAGIDPSAGSTTDPPIDRPGDESPGSSADARGCATARAGADKRLLTWMGLVALAAAPRRLALWRRTD